MQMRIVLSLSLEGESLPSCTDCSECVGFKGTLPPPVCTEFLHAPLVPNVCAFISKNRRPERSIPFYVCSRFAAIRRFITGEPQPWAACVGSPLKSCVHIRGDRETKTRKWPLSFFTKIGLFKDVADSSPQVLLEGSAE